MKIQVLDFPGKETNDLEPKLIQKLNSFIKIQELGTALYNLDNFLSQIIHHLYFSFQLRLLNNLFYDQHPFALIIGIYQIYQLIILFCAQKHCTVVIPYTISTCRKSITLFQCPWSIRSQSWPLSLTKHSSKVSLSAIRRLL